jgi:hypothetical protein
MNFADRVSEKANELTPEPVAPRTVRLQDKIGIVVESCEIARDLVSVKDPESNHLAVTHRLTKLLERHGDPDGKRHIGCDSHSGLPT